MGKLVLFTSVLTLSCIAFEVSSSDATFKPRVDSVEKRSIFGICDNCKREVWLMQFLTPDRLMKMAESTLSTMCLGIQFCKQEVNYVAENINHLTPKQACSILRLCSSATMETISPPSTTEPPAISTRKPVKYFDANEFCYVCKNVVDKIWPNFEHNSMTQLAQSISIKCSEGTNFPECVNRAAVVSKYLSQRLTATKFCELSLACSESGQQIKADSRPVACRIAVSDAFKKENLNELKESAKSRCRGMVNCEAVVDIALSVSEEEMLTNVNHYCTL